MTTVTVERTIPATPVRVFEPLADHAHYDRFRGIDASELVSEGDPAPNGIGAVRHIRIGPLRFEEDITAYEPGARLDYLITKLNVPFDHRGGSIRLREADGGTHLEWTTTFRVPIPLLGGVWERIWVPVLRRGFRRVLEDVEQIVAPDE